MATCRFCCAAACRFAVPACRRGGGSLTRNIQRFSKTNFDCVL